MLQSVAEHLESAGKSSCCGAKTGRQGLIGIMAFPTTHWSLLAKATLHGEAEAQAALEELCRRYYAPVRQFIRSLGVAEPEVQDLTQEYFLHVLQKSMFSRADPLRGKFRSFLLGALVRFLRDATDKRDALKRGGAAKHLSLDSEDAAMQSSDDSESAHYFLLFDREWALAILEAAMSRVRSQYEQAKREPEFAVLKNFLPGAQRVQGYEAAAQQLEISVPALKSEVHRLRRDFRAMVRDEVAQTVSAPHEIESEMAHLQRVLMNGAGERGAAA